MALTWASVRRPATSALVCRAADALTRSRKPVKCCTAIWRPASVSKTQESESGKSSVKSTTSSLARPARPLACNGSGAAGGPRGDKPWVLGERGRRDLACLSSAASRVYEVSDPPRLPRAFGCGGAYLVGYMDGMGESKSRATAASLARSRVCVEAYGARELARDRLTLLLLRLGFSLTSPPHTGLLTLGSPRELGPVSARAARACGEAVAH